MQKDISLAISMNYYWPIVVKSGNKLLMSYSTFIVSLCDGFPAAHGSQSAFNHCSLVLMAFS
jgi:hypothetical protein